MTEGPQPDFEWDAEKSARNTLERGIPFDRARDFDFRSAIFDIDQRHDYGETRVTAIGFLGERLHVLTFTRRRQAIRVISLRKANEREVKGYVQVLGIR